MLKTIKNNRLMEVSSDNTIEAMGRQQWEDTYIGASGSPVVRPDSPYGAKTWDEYMQGVIAESERTGARIVPAKQTPNFGYIKPGNLPPVQPAPGLNIAPTINNAGDNIMPHFEIRNGEVHSTLEPQPATITPGTQQSAPTVNTTSDNVTPAPTPVASQAPTNSGVNRFAPGNIGISVPGILSGENSAIPVLEIMSKADWEAKNSAYIPGSPMKPPEYSSYDEYLSAMSAKARESGKVLVVTSNNGTIPGLRTVQVVPLSDEPSDQGVPSSSDGTVAEEATPSSQSDEPSDSNNGDSSSTSGDGAEEATPSSQSDEPSDSNNGDSSSTNGDGAEETTPSSQISENNVDPSDPGSYNSSIDYGEGATRTQEAPVQNDGGRSTSVTTTVTGPNGEVLGSEKVTYGNNYLKVEYYDKDDNLIRKETFTNPSVARQKGQVPSPTSVTDYEEGKVTKRDYDTSGQLIRQEVDTVDGDTKIKSITEYNGNSTKETTVTEGTNGKTTVIVEKTDGIITSKTSIGVNGNTVVEAYTNGVLSTKTEGRTIEGKNYFLITSYDEEGKEIARNSYIEEVVDGKTRRTSYTEDAIIVEEMNEDGSWTEVSRKDSLAKISASNTTKDDNTLRSNLCIVSDDVHAITGSIRPSQSVNYKAATDNEAKVVGAMYDVTNYFGSVTNALYSNLSDESNAIYNIANLIYHMDKAEALLAETNLDETQKGIYSVSNPEIAFDYERLQNSAAGLSSAVEEAMNAADKYSSLTDFFGTNIEAGKVGRISQEALKNAVYNIKNALDEDIATSGQVRGNVSTLLGRFDQGILTGGVWDDVRTNLESYEKLLKVNEQAAVAIEEAVERSMGMIIDYIDQSADVLKKAGTTTFASGIALDEIDDSQLPALEAELKNLQDKIDELTPQLESMVNSQTTVADKKVGEDGKEVITGYHKEPSDEAIAAFRKQLQDVIDTKKILDDYAGVLRGFAPVVAAAQKEIDYVLNQVKDAFGKPTEFLESNKGFDVNLDLSAFGIEDKDYKKIAEDYYNKVKEEREKPAEVPPAEEKPAGTVPDSEVKTDPDPKKDPDPDPDPSPSNPGGPSNPGSPDDGKTPEKTTEKPTEKPTEAPTEKPTEIPTMAPTEPRTEAPTTPTTEAPTVPYTETPTTPVGPEKPTESGGSGGSSKKKKSSGGSGGSSSKKSKKSDVDPLTPTEPYIETEPPEELPVDPIEPPTDNYIEPIIPEPITEAIPIEPIEPEPVTPKKGNGLKTMGIAAGVGLAVGASALGAHTIMKSKEEASEEEDFGYEK